VKQGGVISPILSSQFVSVLGIGRYIAGNFVGAIVYAEDVVLICPTPLGMRKRLFSYDS